MASLSEKNGLRVLVLGSGGREHAICWKLKQSPLLGNLYCLPGNAGIASVAENVSGISVTDVPKIVEWCKENKIDFVCVGPEDPLTKGVVDELDKAGILAFGPTAAAAELEGSKAFMKDILQKSGVPTATYIRTTNVDDAKAYIKKTGAPIVVKASGLCAGKGVILCDTEEEAIQAVDDMMVNKVFSDSGNEIVIEEFLTGEEASYFAFCDGETAIPIAGAQDHKQVGDGDTGPNTGGMGAYSPAPVLTKEIEDRIMKEVMIPTVQGMKKEGRPYKGVLFAGLMIKEDGSFKVLEHNVRFGDPECQTVMMRLKSDLLKALIMAAEGRFAEMPALEWDERTALVVVMASKGYPGSYEKGTPIKNLQAAGEVPDVVVFHAGTADKDGQVVATGGRVLGVTAIGSNAKVAQQSAYKAVDTVDWPNGFCRRDIAHRAVARLS